MRSSFKLKVSGTFYGKVLGDLGNKASGHRTSGGYKAQGNLLYTYEKGRFKDLPRITRTGGTYFSKPMPRDVTYVGKQYHCECHVINR